MKYYFGQVPNEDVEMFGDEGLFEYCGDLYYNMVEFGTNPGGQEDFVIADSVGRSIPISIEHINGLIQVLEDIQSTMYAIESGKAAQEALFNADEIRVLEW